MSEPNWRAPFVQPPSSASLRRAEPARISFTSLHVRSVLAARIRATTPVTVGAAPLVPPKSVRYRP